MAKIGPGRSQRQAVSPRSPSLNAGAHKLDVSSIFFPCALASSQIGSATAKTQTCAPIRDFDNTLQKHYTTKPKYEFHFESCLLTKCSSDLAVIDTNSRTKEI